MVFWQYKFKSTALRLVHLMKSQNPRLSRMCGHGASAPAQMRPTRTAHAARRRRPACGNGARSTSRLRTRPRPAAGAAPPSTAHAGAQRSHPEGCAGRRSGRVRFRCARRSAPWPPGFKRGTKVAGKGTPLPGGALWAHFRKLGGHWPQSCNVAQNALHAMSISVHTQNFKAKSTMVQKKSRYDCKTIFSARKIKWPPNAQGPLPGAKTGAQLGLEVASSKGHMAIATQHKAQGSNLALPPKKSLCLEH